MNAAAPRPATSAALGILILFLPLYGWSLAAAYQNRPTAPSPAVSTKKLALRIDPNTAGRDELMLLPGIGPKIADNIIEYRNRVSPGPAFRAAEDLDPVPRIGPATVEKLRDWLYFPEANAPQPESP